MPIYAVGSGSGRQEESFRRRVEAALLAKNRVHESHTSNGDEFRFRDPVTNNPTFIGNFTKGLPHNDDGTLINPSSYTELIKAIDSADPEVFRRIPLGRAKKEYCPRWRSVIARGLPPQLEEVKARAWESAGAGQAFDLEGADAQSITMPPAPAVLSPEFQFEMAEVCFSFLDRLCDIEPESLILEKYMLLDFVSTYIKLFNTLTLSISVFVAKRSCT